MNKWIGDGRITRPIELKAGPTGTEYCKFTIANDRYKGRDGSNQTDFIDCIAYGKTAAFIAQYFTQGDGINIVGRLESNKYTDKDGNNRVSWGVSVSEVDFPLGKKRSEQTGATPSDPQQPAATESNGDLPF